MKYWCQFAVLAYIDRGRNRSTSGSKLEKEFCSPIEAGPLDLTQEGAALCYVIAFIFTFISLASLDLARASLFRGLLKNQSIVADFVHFNARISK